MARIILPSSGEKHAPSLDLGKAAKFARDLGCTTVQIFAGDPSTFRPTLPDAKAINTFVSIIHQVKMHSVSLHAPLRMNLASADLAVHKTAIGLLRRTLRIAPQVHANFVVVHPGYVKGPDGERTGIQHLVQGLMQAVQESQVQLNNNFQILLENGASKRELGKTPADLLEIYQALPSQLRPFVGICFDLAHAWVTGYDVSTRDGFQRLFHELDSTVGASLVKLIHLNNAKGSCGSYQDHHACWGDENGQMPVTVLSYLQQDSLFRSTPLIMETPLRQQDGAFDWD
jgi:deoxyribonuclease IV